MTSKTTSKTKNAKSKNSVKVKPQPSKNHVSDSEMLGTKLTSIVEALRDTTARRIDTRQELLARVAGAVAAGLVISPSPSIATPSGMATAAVDIAEEILKRIGIASTDDTETSSSPGDEDESEAAA